ncbi:hypothetical protein JCM11491_004834 [Sporobolomyces phaffii]
MTEEQSAMNGGAGKKARRGRRQDDTLPPSRSRDVQRAFRARRAAHLTHLEATVDWLTAENAALRQRCGLPLDGPPLTGNAPVEEVIEGPSEAPPGASTKKAGAGGKAKGKAAKAAAQSAGDHSDEEGKMEEDNSPIPQDEARGAAEVLAGGATNPNNGPLSLPPMNVPSSSSSVPPHSGPPPLASYSLPQQTSPRLQQPNGFQHHPSQIPYLVNHPHSSIGHPFQPPYAPAPYQNTYQSFQGNPGMPYNSYYPHPHAQFAPQQSHPNGNQNPNMSTPFAMTLPPPSNGHVQPYPSQHPPSLTTSQRNSVSSAASPQSATPPSSHLRAPTVPTPAPLGQHQPHFQYQQQHAQPHVYPALIPPPSSVLTKSPRGPAESYPKPLLDTQIGINRDSHDLQHQQRHHEQQQQQQQQAMFNSIFPTPSPEDEQFFLDTFCGLANPIHHGSDGVPNTQDLFLESLFPRPATNATEASASERTDASEQQEQGWDGTGTLPTPRGHASQKVDATRYKSFCVGLMKGVKGIEGLIAHKRKRDREQEGQGGTVSSKKRKCGARAGEGQGESSLEERREKEDEAVAFLAKAAAMAQPTGSDEQRDEGCCLGIIDCGPSVKAEAEAAGEGKSARQDKDECCGGLIDCGDVDDEKSREGTRGNEGKQQGKTGEECCSGLISCEDDSKAPSSLARLSGATSLETESKADVTRPPLTIYLPRMSTSSARRAPSGTSNQVAPHPSDPTDAYILVSLAFTELSRYMSSSPTASPRFRSPSPSFKMSPTRIAELLYNDNPVIASAASSPDGDSSAPPPNLIIVPPTREAEDKGKKGELYVRKRVVETVQSWCEREAAQATTRA